jgi:hypothetical protein
VNTLLLATVAGGNPGDCDGEKEGWESGDVGDCGQSEVLDRYCVSDG